MFFRSMSMGIDEVRGWLVIGDAKHVPRYDPIDQFAFGWWLFLCSFIFPTNSIDLNHRLGQRSHSQTRFVSPYSGFFYTFVRWKGVSRRNLSFPQQTITNMLYNSVVPALSTPLLCASFRLDSGVDFSPIIVIVAIGKSVVAIAEIIERKRKTENNATFI